MLKKSVYENIKTGLQTGVYKNVRLVKKHEGGEREVLIPYARIGKTEEALSRIEYIKLQCDRKLSPGTYVIECRTGNTRGSLQDEFEVIIKPPILLPVKEDNPIIDKTEEQETMQNIELQDYIKLLEENANLKADNKLLQMQLDMLKDFKDIVGKAQNTLNDPQPSSTSDKIINALSDNIPVIAGIFSEFMDQRKKHLELKERELNIKQGIKPMTSKPKKINPDDVVRELQHLYETDADAFEAALDELEEKNPNLYEYCCNALGIEEDEEDEVGEDE